jgi:hypothetical protein
LAWNHVTRRSFAVGALAAGAAITTDSNEPGAGILHLFQIGSHLNQLFLAAWSPIRRTIENQYGLALLPEPARTTFIASLIIEHVHGSKSEHASVEIRQ